jgi:hypothetical protein
MTRSASTLVVAALLVVAMIAVPAAGATQSGAVGAQASHDSEATAQNNETVAPGERLSGVVGVQEAEIDGDVESRAFGIRIANAETADARAQIVAERHQQNRQRIAELEQRLVMLERARQNGSISHGQYAARTARTYAELRQLRRSTNETARVAESLPAERLEANGVNATAIRSLRQRSGELGGPEMAAIARSIAGPSVDRGPPERVGPPERGNATAGEPRGGDGGPDERGPRDGGPGDRGPGDRNAGSGDDPTSDVDPNTTAESTDGQAGQSVASASDDRDDTANDGATDDAGRANR